MEARLRFLGTKAPWAHGKSTCVILNVQDPSSLVLRRPAAKVCLHLRRADLASFRFRHRVHHEAHRILHHGGAEFVPRFGVDDVLDGRIRLLVPAGRRALEEVEERLRPRVGHELVVAARQDQDCVAGWGVQRQPKGPIPSYLPGR